MNTVWRFLYRSRPRFWLYLAGPVLVGLAYGAQGVHDLYSLPALVLFGYFLIPANSFLYGINDIYDAAIDQENSKKSSQEIRYEGSPLTPISVIISGALGLVLLVLVQPAARVYIIAFLLLGAMYSAPPIRFKTRPPLDSLSNGLYILPGAAAYAALTGVHPPVLAVLAGWIWAMGMHTFSAIPDIEPDIRGGIRTMATALGKHGAMVYCGGCWLLAAVVFGLHDFRGGVLLLAYPAVIAGIYIKDVRLDQAYWWYPAINTVVGMTLTLGGLWGLIYG